MTSMMQLAWPEALDLVLGADVDSAISTGNGAVRPQVCTLHGRWMMVCKFLHLDKQFDVVES